MQRALWALTACVAALIALLGHWMTDRPAAAPQTAVAPVHSDGAGVAWLPVTAAAIAVIAAATVWVAWRRHKTTSTASAAAPRPATRAQSVRRWHCIVYVNGVIAMRGYVNHPAGDHLEMQAELERRFVARYADDLPPTARIRVKAAPALRGGVR